MQCLTNLRVLNLSNTGVTDTGLKHLEEMKDLNDLYLGGTLINGSGLKYIVGIKHIRILYVGTKAFSDDAMRYIDRFPELEAFNAIESDGRWGNAPRIDEGS